MTANDWKGFLEMESETMGSVCSTDKDGRIDERTVRAKA